MTGTRVLTAIVLIPLVVGFHIAPVKPGPEARGFYEAIAGLKPGSTVLVAWDYDPGTIAENYPMHLAGVRQLMSRDIKIIGLELYPGGPPLAVDLAVDGDHALHRLELRHQAGANLSTGNKPHGL